MYRIGDRIGYTRSQYVRSSTAIPFDRGSGTGRGGIGLSVSFVPTSVLAWYV